MSPEDLDRRIGLVGATAVGVGSMIGAGLFIAFPTAAHAAGRGIWAALAVAAVVAVCNAWSSARLAARYPSSGGTYVYGRERLGTGWGVLAGAAFVVGKTASLAVMSTAIGRHVWPEHPVVAALVALFVVTLVNLAGVQRSTGALVAIVLVVLVVVVVAVLRLLDAPAADDALPTGDVRGVVEAAGVLFFAFAGYARLATLGGEVRRPERTIPRAIAISVALVAVVYAASLAALLHALGPTLSSAEAPFPEALRDVGAPRLAGLVAVAAVVSAAGALLSLGLGVSRTTYAMARDGHLPRRLAVVGRRSGAPWAAELATAAAAAALLVTIDVGSTVVVSSVCVLVYYAVANASAATLPGRAGRAVAVGGLVGCLALTLALLTSPL